MIQLKDLLIKVKCLECGKQQLIEMKHIETEKAQRDLGFEYEHIYQGKQKCIHCEEEIKVETLIFEYPKGFLNYHETNNESCIILDDITDDSFIVNDSFIINTFSSVKNKTKIKIITEKEYLEAQKIVDAYKEQMKFAKEVLKEHLDEKQRKREENCGDHYYIPKGIWQSGMRCQDCGKEID